MNRSHYLLIFSLFITTFFPEIKAQKSLFCDYTNLRNARVGFFVKDLSNDSIIIDFNSRQLFSPASNTKLFTTALALHNLDLNFHYETPVVLFGKTKRNGIFSGLVVLKTSGDPSLSSLKYRNRNNPAETILDMFKVMNVRTFKGDIRIDEQVIYDGSTPRNWLFDDLSMPWGAGVYASNFNDNTIWYKDEKAHVQMWDTAGICEGGIAIADMDPGCSMLKYIDNTLLSSNIKHVKRHPKVNLTQPLMADTIRSLNLAAIIKEINYESRNMWAESLLLEATTSPDSIRVFRHASDSLSAFWREKLNEKRIYFHDGSGMSPYNAISPQAIVSLLEYMLGTELFTPFLNALPAPGEGSLDDMEIILSNGRSIKMKSGSFTRVRCYSGYVLDENGAPEYAFSLMVNDFDCTHREMKGEIARFLGAVL